MFKRVKKFRRGQKLYYHAPDMGRALAVGDFGRKNVVYDRPSVSKENKHYVYFEGVLMGVYTRDLSE